jgi:hypothetical protein
MSVAQIYREKADQLMHLAARTTNNESRSRYIDQAARWHEKALEAEVRSETLRPRPSEPRSWAVR